MRKFIYEGQAWPELQTHNINGMRFYEVPNGDKYPSITSVLGSRPEKKKGLQEWRDRIENLAAPAPQQPALESQMDAMTPEQREGVNVVNEIVQSQVGDLPQTVAQLQELVQQMYQTQNTSTQQAMVQQVAEARSAHGNDIDNWADQIGALVGQQNPLTGSTYTVKESYELLSGKAAQDAESARQTDRNVRSSHQAAATSPTGTPVVSHEGLTDMSLAEGRAGLEALGFER